MSNKLKTFVIDDDDSVMRVFVLLLEKLGCESNMALSTKHAIKLNNKELLDSDLVFLDIGIPGESFKSNLDDLFSLKKDMKIIVMSGAIYDDERTLMKDRGVYKIISKPVSLEELKEIIGLIGE
jgi:DNA-binding NtrC family response regulator